MIDANPENSAISHPGSAEAELMVSKEKSMPSDGTEGSRPDEVGIAAADLSDTDLLRELEQLHRTRQETFLHGPTSALQHHSERTAELELEYLRRHPERDVDQSRLRDHEGSS
jgi:Family of unknown function (DUF6158)